MTLRRPTVPSRLEHLALSLSFLTKFKALASLLLLFAIASLTSDYFVHWGNLMNIIRQASTIGVIALGVHFVILLGMFDLSVGSILAASGTVIMLSQSALGIGIPASVTLGLAAGCVLGIANGMLVAFGRVPSFIVTLGTMFIFRSLAMWYGHGGAINGNFVRYTQLGHSDFWGVPLIFLPLAVIAVMAHVVLSRTLLGRYIYAFGQNPYAAVLTGAPIPWVIVTAFAISGAATGVGAVFETSRLNSISTSSSGLFYELDVISAIVIGGSNLKGGKGTILGTVCGVFMLTIIGNYMNLQNISPYLQGIIKGALVLLILYRQGRKA
ncbi:ABC transporter permease [Cohnella caldifontis]|uniref:ABC transporter permease n=1 Tax=Cohnella caldifontis TaxID=3027471 RepID=UPI0023EBE9CE|nr:ABC transporter permease [Cohnella sp. YIM B05605]